MNIKRAILFGVFFWIGAFVSISILMFLPWFKDSETRMYIGWFVIEIPLVLLLAKWYFRVDTPTIKKGFLLGIIGIMIGTLLDMIITIPLFIAPEYSHPYSAFYSEWKLYLGFVIGILLTTYAGFEFDTTYIESENGKK